MARQTLRSPTRKLWIVLFIILLFLGLNALSTIQGWSPFASIAQERIQSKTTPESLRKRVSPSKEETKPKRHSLIPPAGQSPPAVSAPQHSMNSTTQMNATTAPPAQPVPSYWLQHAPYAPVPPVAPQQFLKQPTRPMPPQPVTHQFAYPERPVQQITYPYYYPQPVTPPAQ